jgi:hypothetical protein
MGMPTETRTYRHKCTLTDMLRLIPNHNHSHRDTPRVPTCTLAPAHTEKDRHKITLSNREATSSKHTSTKVWAHTEKEVNTPKLADLKAYRSTQTRTPPSTYSQLRNDKHS